MPQQPDILQMLSGDKRAAEAKRERNRELAALHMPDFLRLLDGLKDAGMSPKVVHFEIYEQRKAA